MRRFWPSLVVVVALASGGIANAMVMADCPMLERVADAAMSGEHACCPDDTPAAPSEQPAKQMGDCAMGQACRAGPAMAPTIEPVSIVLQAIVARDSVVSDTGAASRAPDAFWRPPRTI